MDFMLEHIESHWRFWNSSEKRDGRTFEYFLIWGYFFRCSVGVKYNQTYFSWLFCISKQLLCEYLSKFLLIFTIFIYSLFTIFIYFLCSLQAVQFWLPCKYIIDYFKEYASITGTVISMTIHLRKRFSWCFLTLLYLDILFFTWSLHILLHIAFAMTEPIKSFLKCRRWFLENFKILVCSLICRVSLVAMLH